MVSFRILKRALLAPVVACLLAAPQAAPAQQPAVTLSFNAVDKSGRAVTNLRREDVRVLEDGVPQEVLTLERRDAQPLAIILALDMSLSQEKIIPVAKQAAQHLIDSLSQERDSVGVLRVTGEAIFAQELTDKLEQARGAVGGLEFKPPAWLDKKGAPVPGPADIVQGSTAIWDAVWLASEKLGSQSTADARRVIILFTDGFDTSSKRKLNEVIEGSIKARTVVYSMGVGDEYYGGVNKGELRKLSERTGGSAFFPAKAPELREAFAELSDELASQYVVTYSPAAAKGSGDKMRKVKIEVINPELRKQKVRLAHPQGYYEKRP